MTKIVYAPLSPRSSKANGKKRSKPTSVTAKRVKTEAGGFVTMYRVDSHSPTLGQDLAYVFAQNVKRARRDHKRLLGLHDRAAKKS